MADLGDIRHWVTGPQSLSVTLSADLLEDAVGQLLEKFQQLEVLLPRLFEGSGNAAWTLH